MVAPIIPSVENLTKLKITFVIFLLTSMLLIGADFAFGELAPQMTNILIIYMILYLSAIAAFPKTEQPDQAILPAIGVFLIGFILTLMVMIFVSPLFGAVIAASTVESAITFGLFFGVTHAFVKAYIEEDIFRNRLSVQLGEVGQSIVFGLFHFFILFLTFGFSPNLFLSMGWLIALGFIWGFMNNKLNLIGATGSHFAYNLVAFGMLPIVFGSVIV